MCRSSKLLTNKSKDDNMNVELKYSLTQVNKPLWDTWVQHMISKPRNRGLSEEFIFEAELARVVQLNSNESHLAVGYIKMDSEYLVLWHSKYRHYEKWFKPGFFIPESYANLLKTHPQFVSRKSN